MAVCTGLRPRDRVMRQMLHPGASTAEPTWQRLRGGEGESNCLAQISSGAAINKVWATTSCQRMQHAMQASCQLPLAAGQEEVAAVTAQGNSPRP
jgi:hypothetical protein